MRALDPLASQGNAGSFAVDAPADEKITKQVAKHSEPLPQIRRSCAANALLLVLLTGCAATDAERAYPHSAGWRKVEFVEIRTGYRGVPFRDCRDDAAGTPFLVFTEHEKISRFVTVSRDWLVPADRPPLARGAVAVLNINSCAAGYHLLEKTGR